MIIAASVKLSLDSRRYYITSELMFIVGIVTAVFVFFLANALTAE